ncbi:Isochorismatase-like protein [Mycena alexandri]|uniref:Isochorismatase-like protein n=1 Tax=Mycena alexandri TaxID=1745969 RepID=A0AAD6SYJ7_9AGAR|nr:Isochorismatase-like protein [Mycena alexandri]
MSSSYLVPDLPKTALVVIDVQQAFIDPSFLKRDRSTPNMQPNITALLAAFRSKHLPVIHIHHIDVVDETSLWNEKSHPEGVLPQDYVQPLGDEPVLRKYDKSSGFGANLVADGKTSLKDTLDAQGIKTIILVGLSSPHCVSSTARVGFDNGFSVVVVGDACATYAAGIPDFPGATKGDLKDGKAWSAETVHGLAMAHLDGGELAHVVGTPEVLKFL